MKQAAQARPNGFSLIEVLIGIFILAFGMIAGLGMTKAGRNGLDAGRRLTEATALARAAMEQRLSAAYLSLISRDLAGEEEVNGYLRVWRVEPGRPHPRSATIQVAVEWKDASGRTHAVRLSAIRSEGVVP